MRSRQRGFTLVEIIVVAVVVLLILGAIWGGLSFNRARRVTTNGVFSDTSDRYLEPGQTATLQYVVTRRRADGTPVPFTTAGVTFTFTITGNGGCTVAPASGTATNANRGIISVTVNRPPAPGAQGANVLEATGPGGASGPGDRVNIEYGPP